MPRPPLILGHRGAPGLQRENTIASFDAAVKAGADGIELDVRSVTDGLVLHHDATLRLRGRRKALNTLRLADLPSWMPTLEELVEWAGHNEAVLDVEIKEAGQEERILQVLRPLLHRCVISSFLPDVVHRIGELQPKAQTAWICKAEAETTLALASQLRPRIVVIPASRFTALLVASLLSQGMQLWAWKVQTAASAQRLWNQGVSAFITDEPAILSDWRDDAVRQQRAHRKDRRES